MGGLNKTGVPSTDNYNLGRGKLYAAALDANDMPISYRDLGNCPEFTIGLETETLEHQSSRSGLKVTDKKVTLSQVVNLNITLDNLEFDNLKYFFSASVSEWSSTTAAISDRLLVSGLDVDEYIIGKWFDLTDASGNRIYGLDWDTSTELVVTMANNSGFSSPGTLVKDDDFVLDEAMGRIMITNTGAITSTYVGQGNYWLKFTTTSGLIPAAKAIDELQLFQQSSVSVALKFIAQNPANADEQTEWQFHKVTLQADGDLSMIGDDWSTIALSGVAEEAPGVDADAPIGYARTYPNAGVSA